MHGTQETPLPLEWQLRKTDQKDKGLGGGFSWMISKGDTKKTTESTGEVYLWLSCNSHWAPNPKNLLPITPSTPKLQTLTLIRSSLSLSLPLSVRAILSVCQRLTDFRRLQTLIWFSLSLSLFHTVCIPLCVFSRLKDFRGLQTFVWSCFFLIKLWSKFDLEPLKGGHNWSWKNGWFVSQNGGECGRLGKPVCWFEISPERSGIWWIQSTSAIVELYIQVFADK